MVSAVPSCTVGLGHVLGWAIHSWLSQWSILEGEVAASSSLIGFEYLSETTCAQATSILGVGLVAESGI